MGINTGNLLLLKYLCFFIICIFNQANSTSEQKHFVNTLYIQHGVDQSDSYFYIPRYDIC